MHNLNCVVDTGHGSSDDFQAIYNFIFPRIKLSPFKDIIISSTYTEHAVSAKFDEFKSVAFNTLSYMYLQISTDELNKTDDNIVDICKQHQLICRFPNWKIKNELFKQK